MQARVLWTLGDLPLQIAACRVVVDARQRPASHQPIDLREKLGPRGETRLALKDVGHFVHASDGLLVTAIEQFYHHSCVAHLLIVADAGGCSQRKDLSGPACSPRTCGLYSRFTAAWERIVPW